MRHLLANIVTYTIAALLLAGAALFAWLRSAQVVIADEATVLARFEPVPEAHDFEWRELGGRSYVANCLNCHGRDGQGWDQYPGLDHTARMFNAPGGRDYLIDVHLFGLTSDRWRAPMPPMGHMRDVELAAVLNHVLTHFGNDAMRSPDLPLYAPADVQSRRGGYRSPAAVNRDRPSVTP